MRIISSEPWSRQIDARAHLAILPDHCAGLFARNVERFAMALDIARLVYARDAERLAALEVVLRNEPVELLDPMASAAPWSVIVYSQDEVTPA